MRDDRWETESKKEKWSTNIIKNNTPEKRRRKGEKRNLENKWTNEINKMSKLKKKHKEDSHLKNVSEELKEIMIWIQTFPAAKTAFQSQIV